jgi:hypothetical protein
MPKFRKKPVVIEAVHWTGENYKDIYSFLESHGMMDVVRGEWGNLFIPTLEGEMIASPGDWIIRGVQGEFYPCKPDIFEETYEPVDE